MKRMDLSFYSQGVDLATLDRLKKKPTEEVLGYSPKGRPIECKRLGDGPIPVLLIGGVHGDEWEGVQLVKRFTKFLENSWREPRLSVWILPLLNPDGFEKNTRVNANQVDLNRNLPTKDWDPVPSQDRYSPGEYPGSEIENRVLIQVIEASKPKFIVSAHSYEIPMINVNGDCSGFQEAMRSANHLPISPDIGYPTPGSLGTYTGKERQIPTITLEILKDQDEELTWRLHRGALLGALAKL
jgi:protein MpaA